MPDYAAQYKALKDAKRAAQKAKGTSAAGKGKKVKKKKWKETSFQLYIRRAEAEHVVVKRCTHGSQPINLCVFTTWHNTFNIHIDHYRNAIFENIHWNWSYMKKYQNQKQRCDRVVHTCESEKVKVKEEGMFFIQMVLNQLNRRNKVYTMYIHTCTQGCHCKLLTGSHWPLDVWKVCGGYYLD